MENATPTTSRIHPLLAAAAIAIILVCLVGVAAMTGLLPTSKGNETPPASPVAQIPASPVAQTQVEPMQQQASTPSYPPPRPQTTAPAQLAQAAVPVQRPVPAPAPITRRCTNCGEVVAIRAIQTKPKASGLGIAAGAVLGGVLGSQIGNGNGRTLATVAGVLGGGYAGNEVGKNAQARTSYIVEVRMENGSIHNFPQTNEGWRVGDRVRVINGRLSSRM